jgi:hypothetical protein
VTKNIDRKGWLGLVLFVGAIGLLSLAVVVAVLIWLL